MPSHLRPSKPADNDGGFVVPNLRTKKVKKSVNVGVQGQTPKKIITYTDTRVDVGSNGETPIKKYEYDAGEAIYSSMSSANQFSPEKVEPVQASRPKTSRGKAHPSPDEYFDYVVPSPMNMEKLGKGSKFVVFNEGENIEYKVDSKADENYRELQRQHEEDMADKRDQIRMLGCWLFGSALRV